MPDDIIPTKQLTAPLKDPKGFIDKAIGKLMAGAKIAIPITIIAFAADKGLDYVPVLKDHKDVVIPAIQAATVENPALSMMFSVQGAARGLNKIVLPAVSGATEGKLSLTAWGADF